MRAKAAPNWAAHLSPSSNARLPSFAIILSLARPGETRVRYAKARHYITVDVQIPEAVWQPMSKRQFRSYLAHQIKGAVAVCAARLLRDKHVVSENDFYAEIDAAINEYLAVENDG